MTYGQQIDLATAPMRPGLLDEPARPHHAGVDSADDPVVGRLAAEAKTHQQLVAARSTFQWKWIPGRPELRRITLEVAVSASDMLLAGDLHRVFNGKQFEVPDLASQVLRVGPGRGGLQRRPAR